jgi:putative transposase
MSRITRTYRIRAYPNGAQRRLLDRWFGATRWLTQWKRTPGHEWLAEIPATVLTQCLRDQDAAFRNLFGGRARYPRFKRKSTLGSVRFQDVGRAWMRGTLSLPKLDSLKLAETLPEVARPDLKRCSECQYTLDELRLDQRQWTCPKCGFRHDRDVNAARNLLAEGLRQLAGREDRDLRVDAGDACPEEILVQVLAEEARSGQRNRACLE